MDETLKVISLRAEGVSDSEVKLVAVVWLPEVLADLSKGDVEAFVTEANAMAEPGEFIVPDHEIVNELVDKGVQFAP